MNLALNRAQQAYSDADLSSTFAALLEAWRTCPDPFLGDAIVQMSRTMPCTSTDPPGLEDLDAVETWIRKAGTAKQASSRLRELKKKHSPDPRLSDVALRLLKPRSFSTYADFQLHVFRTLEAQADPRILDRLDTLDLVESRVHKDGHDVAIPSAIRHNKKLRELHERISNKHGEALLPASERAIVNRIVGKAKLSREAIARRNAHWNAILGSPEDDALRLIYGDFLTEQGDPRGDLITLSALDSPTPEQATRLERLLGLARQRWLVQVLPVLDLEPEHLHLGFLRHATISSTSLEKVDQAGGSREWHLVRTARLTKPAHLQVLLDPAFRSLRRVDGVGTLQEAALLSFVHPHLKELRFKYQKNPDRVAHEPCNFTQLRRLHISPGQQDRLGSILGNSVVRLKVLHLEIVSPNVLGGLRALREVRGHADRTELILRQGSTHLEVHTRINKAGTWEYALKLRGNAERQRALLNNLPTGNVRLVQSTNKAVRAEATTLYPKAKIK